MMGKSRSCEPSDAKLDAAGISGDPGQAGIGVEVPHTFSRICDTPSKVLRSSVYRNPPEIRNSSTGAKVRRAKPAFESVPVFKSWIGERAC